VTPLFDANKSQELHNLGQSLWLDNITSAILDNGTLRRYMNEFSVTGLTSNPTIFDEAIVKSWKKLMPRIADKSNALAHSG
jgi:transaldolase